MTTAQKIIKYLAFSFAIFLIVTIISAILGGMYGLSGVLGLRNDDVIGEMRTLDIENSEVLNLDIDVAYTNLTIKTGDNLKIETNNENISLNQNGNSLQIKEKSHNWISGNNGGDLILYIPENLEFEEITINAGAGKVSIERLNAKKLDFELGAGETEIKNLNVTRNCDIDGGAGKVSILSGTINNLDLDIGVGETNLTAVINGRNDIDAGVGALNITLLGNKENYKIKTDKGVGSIKIDGKEVSDGEVFGSGENYIEIDGGVGSIRVDFKNE